MKTILKILLKAVAIISIWFVLVLAFKHSLENRAELERCNQPVEQNNDNN